MAIEDLLSKTDQAVAAEKAREEAALAKAQRRADFYAAVKAKAKAAGLTIAFVRRASLARLEITPEGYIGMDDNSWITDPSAIKVALAVETDPLSVRIDRFLEIESELDVRVC